MIATIDIKPDILKVISKIAKDEGTDEKTIINDFLSEAIEEYTDCELLERLNNGVAEIRAGEGIEGRS
jgi:predicted transcriptional regulator